jgi:hypothetical protein
MPSSLNLLLLLTFLLGAAWCSSLGFGRFEPGWLPGLSEGVGGRSGLGPGVVTAWALDEPLASPYLLWQGKLLELGSLGLIPLIPDDVVPGLGPLALNKVLLGLALLSSLLPTWAGEYGGNDGD